MRAMCPPRKVALFANLHVAPHAHARDVSAYPTTNSGRPVAASSLAKIVWADVAVPFFSTRVTRSRPAAISAGQKS